MRCLLVETGSVAPSGAKLILGLPRVPRQAALPPRRCTRGYIPTPHPGRFEGVAAFPVHHNTSQRKMGGNAQLQTVLVQIVGVWR